ncbi:MAG: hypothetical protein HKN71_11115 [Gemmatimonadetes bacterium]|nr:hypothetical protein [Gemmatimonadota bacterium]
MLRIVRLLLMVVLLGVTACADQPTAEDPGDIPRSLLEPTLSIVDGITGQGGNPGFKWLQPIGDRLVFSGRGDGTLYPRIEICPRNAAGDGCDNAPILVEFNRDDPDGDRRISLDGRNHYTAIWRMRDVRPETGGIYRIRVLIGDQELGHADIIGVSRPSLAAFLRRSGADPLPVSDRGVFVIRFRIEEGALEDQFCDFDGDGDVQDCDAGVERPGDGLPTQVQVTAQGAGGGTEVAAVITAPDGVFTDINGTPIPDVVLTAEVEIVPPSDDVYPDNQELPFFVEVNTIPNDVYIDPNGPGVNVVICQDTPALAAKGVTEALHPQLILYKVGDNGVTKRLPSTYGAPECDDHGGGVGGMASLLQRGTRSLLEIVGPNPLNARRLHGGLNTVIRRPVGTADAPFSTFGSALGPNAAQSSAVVPPTVLVGDVVAILVQVRDALGNNVPFGGDVITATITGANTGAPVTVVDNLDGTYAVSYTAAAAGTDQIDLVLDRMDIIVPSSIGGSPYTVDVQTALVGNATVPGGATGFTTFMWLDVTDGQGAPVPGATVQGTVSGANSASLTVQDNQDGSYLLQYDPLVAGTDQIDITVNGGSIGGPFSSTVYAPQQLSGNGHFYQIRPVLRRAPYNLWTTANAEANGASHQGLPGHLLVVDDAAEQASLGPLLSLGISWIGFADEDDDGTYEWVTGQTLAILGNNPVCVAAYCNFVGGEPNNNGGVEFYGEIWQQGVWNDIPNDPGQRIAAALIEYEPLVGSLTVTVTDGSVPLPGVAVTLSPSSLGAITNGNGVATFTGVPAGSYTVSGSLVGFTFPNTNVTVTAFGAANASLTGAPSTGVISGTLPTSGLIGFGQLITVQGSGFPAGATVEFTQGGSPVPAQFTWAASSTAIVVRSPPSSGFVPGPVDLTVTSNQGTSAPFSYTFTVVPAAPVLLEPAAGANVQFGAQVLVGGHGVDTNSSRYQVELVQGPNIVSIKGLSSVGGSSGLPANASTMPASGGVFVPGPATIRMRIGDGFFIPFGPWASVNVNIVP